jgi:hypothetical protein
LCTRTVFPATTVTVPPSTGKSNVHAGWAWGADIRADLVSENTLNSAHLVKLTWPRPRSRRHDVGPAWSRPLLPRGSADPVGSSVVFAMTVVYHIDF